VTGRLRERARRPPLPGDRQALTDWWRAVLPAAVLAVLGGVLVAQRTSLWYDELYTAEVGTAGLGDLARAVWRGEGTTSYLRDVPPSYNAPYYAVVHLWLAVTRLPADDVGLRLLALVPAVAAVAVLVRAVTRLAGAQVALAAGLLAATSPLVVEYSAEARMYGLALLATAGTLLGLARWLAGERRALLLFGLSATATGLAHWFALPVVAALALAALVLRGRRALPLLAVSALAALPVLALVGLSRLNGTGTSAVGRIDPGERPLPLLALEAWSGGSRPLLVALLACCAIAVARHRSPALVVAGTWVALPLLLVWGAELVRPVFVPRYLLATLLGVALLAALGPSGRWRLPVVGALVALSLLACHPLLDRLPEEDAKGAVAALARMHEPGQPVVAVDRRAALALEHYAPPGVAGDLLVPPADPPDARVVWLVRNADGERLQPSDDDTVLLGRGMSVAEQVFFPGSRTGLALQRWERRPE
jgi:mannosyltransferase